MSVIDVFLVVLYVVTAGDFFQGVGSCCCS